VQGVKENHGVFIVFAAGVGYSFVPREAYLAKKEEDLSPALHEIRATKDRTANGSLGICL